ncbi:MAG TPA: outer membrane porin, OprD family [Verrucomicrobiales bacterium]|nr:outer membrane porin, OprD family [Verrucomicrobiales bacterium]
MRKSIINPSFALIIRGKTIEMKPGYLQRLLLSFVLLGTFQLCAQEVEYLAAEEESPKSLEDLRSPIAEMIDQDQGILLERGLILPKIQKRYPKMPNFIQDTRLHLNLRTYYFDRDQGNGTENEALAQGAAIDLKTGRLFDSLSIGTTVYHSEKIYGPEGRDGTGLLQASQKSYTSLGQAYLQAEYRRLTGKFYRQEFSMPFLNRNDARMSPNSFQAYSLFYQLFDSLEMVAAHTTHMKTRTSTNFIPMSEAAGATGSNEGMTTFGARYRFNDEFSLGGGNHHAWDIMNILYMQAEANENFTENLTMRTSLQFTDQRDAGRSLVGRFETQSYGAKVALDYKGLITTLGGTYTSDKNGIRSPFGGHANYASLMLEDFDRAGEEVLFAGVSYHFDHIGIPGFSAFARYAYGNTPESGSAASPDQQEFDVTLDYRFPRGLWKHLWIRMRGAWTSQDDFLGSRSRNNYRLILNYSIPLI